jgi:hypothetical protein
LHTQTRTRTHTQGVDSIGGLNTCLVQPSMHSRCLPVNLPPLCVWYWQCFMAARCAIESDRFLFLLIEITFIFPIVLEVGHVLYFTVLACNSMKLFEYALVLRAEREGEEVVSGALTSDRLTSESSTDSTDPEPSISKLSSTCRHDTRKSGTTLLDCRTSPIPLAHLLRVTRFLGNA